MCVELLGQTLYLDQTEIGRDATGMKQTIRRKMKGFAWIPGSGRALTPTRERRKS